VAIKFFNKRALKRTAALLAAACPFLLFTPMALALVNCAVQPGSGTVLRGDSLAVELEISPTSGTHIIWGMDIYVFYDPAVFDTPTLIDHNLGSGWNIIDVHADFLPNKVQFSKGTLGGDPPHEDWGYTCSGPVNVYRLVFPVKSGAPLGPTTISIDTSVNTYSIMDDSYMLINGSTTDGSFTIADNSPPGTFNLLSPADTATDISLTPALDWEDSTDPDGHTVTYTLQIDNESSFTAPLSVVRAGLGSSNYNVTPGDGLAVSTTYYWRVIASDGHGGETIAGPWSFTTTSVVPNPFLHIKALMQGFYNGSTQVDTQAVVELRDTVDHVVDAFETSLNSNGESTFELTGIPAGGYYVAIKHKISGAPPNANHLAIMTESAVSFSSGSTTNLDVSDPSSPDYVAAYNPDPLVLPDPMIDEGSMKVMRGGDANGDGLVNVADFGIWGAANGTSPGDADWNPAADFNGDDVVNVADFGIFGANNGYSSYVP